MIGWVILYLVILHVFSSLTGSMILHLHEVEEGTSYQKLPACYSGVAQKLYLAMKDIVLHLCSLLRGKPGRDRWRIGLTPHKQVSLH